MKKIVFATHNAHKLEEVRMILRNEAEVVGLTEIGCLEEIPEDAVTLEENAQSKAMFVYEKYGFVQIKRYFHTESNSDMLRLYCKH